MMKGHPSARPASGWRTGGFTLMEVLVASVVISVALLGVYALLQHALAAESRSAKEWRAHGQAQTLAAELADAIEQAVKTERIPALVAMADPSGSGDRLLTCMTNPSSAGGGYELRRYRWRPGADADHPGRLELQVMRYAGSVNLTDKTAAADESSEDASLSEEAWGRVPATVIGHDVDALTVEFRSVGKRAAGWTSQWRGSAPVTARVRVTIGDRSEEVVVTPKALAGSWSTN